MSRHIRPLACAALLAALSLAVGCGGQASRINGLSQHSADKLLARQAARSQMARQGQKPLTPAQLEQKGDAEAMRGKWLSALLYFHQALGKSESARAQNRLAGKVGMVNLKTRSWADAERHLARAAAAMPDKAPLWRGLGYARLGRNNLAGAEAALRKALRLDPSDWRAANALGVSLNWQKRPDEALVFFRRALASQPGNPELLNNQGLSLVMLGRNAEAERSFLAAIASQGGSSRAANNLGLLYAKLGRNRDALAAFSRGVGRAKAHNNLGLFLAWRGDTLAASEEFRKAIKAMPSYYQKAGRFLRQLNGEAAQDD